jgi:oligoribonuclease NrnB/cAMP/cGMP phosphodiesterase (DHH superfamily)
MFSKYKSNFSTLNKKSKILNITHAHCLDGCGCQIVLNNYFDNVVYLETSYSNIDTMLKKLDSTEFDYILLTDICPSDESLLNKHKNLILIDHHKFSTKFHNPKKNHFVYDGECGTSLTKKFIEEIFLTDLSYLNDIVFYINDYDMWILEDSFSKELASLFFKYYNKKFMKKFKTGIIGLTNDDVEFIKKEKHKVKEAIDNLKIFDFDHIKGCITSGYMYVNDICHHLLNKDDNQVVFFRNIKTGNISIRCNDPYDLTKVFDDVKIGGGHANAGAFHEVDNKELISKLQIFEKSFCKNFPNIKR